MSEERLKNLLHSAFPQPDSQNPSRDLWPSIVDHIQAPTAWSWLDMSVAAGVVAGVAIVLVTHATAPIFARLHGWDRRTNAGPAGEHDGVCVLSVLL